MIRVQSSTKSIWKGRLWSEVPFKLIMPSEFIQDLAKLFSSSKFFCETDDKTREIPFSTCDTQEYAVELTMKVWLEIISSSGQNIYSDSGGEDSIISQEYHRCSGKTHNASFITKTVDYNDADFQRKDEIQNTNIHAPSFSMVFNGNDIMNESIFESRTSTRQSHFLLPKTRTFGWVLKNRKKNESETMWISRTIPTNFQLLARIHQDVLDEQKDPHAFMLHVEGNLKWYCRPFSSDGLPLEDETKDDSCIIHNFENWSPCPFSALKYLGSSSPTR